MIVTYSAITSNLNFMDSFKGDMEEIMPYLDEDGSYGDFFKDYLDENGLEYDDGTN